eukprot:scaffold48_cov311-Pinguiococcus_pyrenoidosus.AAC.309
MPHPRVWGPPRATSDHTCWGPLDLIELDLDPASREAPTAKRALPVGPPWTQLRSLRWPPCCLTGPPSRHCPRRRFGAAGSLSLRSLHSPAATRRPPSSVSSTKPGSWPRSPPGPPRSPPGWHVATAARCRGVAYPLGCRSPERQPSRSCISTGRAGCETAA